MAVRGLSQESAGGGYGLDHTGSYNCNVWALHKDVDDQVRANSDSPLSPDRDATIYLTQQALTRRERLWATKFFGTSIWTKELAGQAAADATHVSSGTSPRRTPSKTCARPRLRRAW